MTRKILLSLGLLSKDQERDFLAVTRTELEAFHTPRYLDAFLGAELGQIDVKFLEMGLGSPECPVFRGMFDCCAIASGAALAGARMLLSGEAKIVFSPSGGFHHAHRERASGFCYFNDVVLACQKFAAGGKRVLFLDVDVHHCDGVQDAFYDRNDVMTLSLHQDGRTLFPGTGFIDEIGRGDGLGACVNVPLPPGMTDDLYSKVFDEVALPLAQAFRPDVIVLELGMDGLAGDPLAGWRLTNNTHAEVITSLLAMECPLLILGGGGYQPDRCARSWALAWSILCGDDSNGETVAGMGGMMLETTDWSGGLRDRLLSPQGNDAALEEATQAIMREVREKLFSFYGIN